MLKQLIITFDNDSNTCEDSAYQTTIIIVIIIIIIIVYQTKILQISYNNKIGTTTPSIGRSLNQLYKSIPQITYN